MIAGCRFRDGGVLLADSRCTWEVRGRTSRLYQDSLQKILYLDKKLAIAYAGDVAAAGLIVRHLRERLRAKPQLRCVEKLAAYLPRLAKHHYSRYRSRSRLSCGVHFILAGITRSGSSAFWSYDYPEFSPVRLTEKFVVRGSGDLVHDFLSANIEEIDGDNYRELKVRADRLILGLESELRRLEIESVGGLLQVILLDVHGIRPMHYGYLNLDPHAAPDGREIDLVAGRWVQRDTVARLDYPLAEPAELLTSAPQEFRLQDFHLPSQDEFRWHLVYFLTCLQVTTAPGKMGFDGVMTAIAATSYPRTITVLAALGFWGPIGDHNLEFYFEQGGGRTLIHQEQIHIEALQLEVDIALPVNLPVTASGPAFLDCYLRGRFLGRRALYFGLVSGEQPTTEEEMVQFAQRQSAVLIEQESQNNDPQLEATGRAALVYHAVCKNAVKRGTHLAIEGLFAASFWRSYPLKLRLFLASGFRLAVGAHLIEVLLVNAATRGTTPITSASVTSTSSCSIIEIHSEVISVIPEPGIYFINVMIDGELLASVLYLAETENPEYWYLLTDEDRRKVLEGQLLLTQKPVQTIRLGVLASEAG